MEHHTFDIESTIDVQHFARNSRHVIACEQECRSADLARFHGAAERRLPGGLVEKPVEMLDAGGNARRNGVGERRVDAYSSGNAVFSLLHR